MRALVALSIMMLLALAGCSGPSFYWYHPDRPLDEAQADYFECQGQARQKADDMISEEHYDRVPPLDDSSTASGSLTDRARSANPRETQDAWRQRYEQSVLADCMRAKGYLQVRPGRIPHGVHTKKLPKGGVAGR